MFFTLEAVKAGQGDALLVHYGESDEPLLAVIDGGPSGTYVQSLRPRLDKLHRARAAPDEPLPLQLVAISHIDDDHIRGILDLTDALVEAGDAGDPANYEILGIWHNSFDDIVGGDGVATTPAAVATLAAGGSLAGGETVSEPSRLVVASIAQGRRLRDNIARLSLDVNNPFDDLVVAPRTVDWGDGLSLTVLGPQKSRLDDLHKKWDADVRKRQAAETKVAEYLDGSVYNLSSIVVLAEAGGKKMLLTGDARGDDILAGLTGAELLKKDEPFHVDILKLPHHGSDRNVETDFFRKIVADHYVVSGDGTDDNPETATLKMISEARKDDDFTLHLTNRTGKNDIEKRLSDFEASERAKGRTYEIEFRDDAALSLKVDLLDPVTD